MNRFSTLTAIISIAAAAALAPLAAQAGPSLHPVAGVLHSMPGMDPGLGHGIVVDPIGGRPVLNTPDRQNPGPITPIKRAPGLGNENNTITPPIQRTPVIGTGGNDKPVLGTGNGVVTPIKRAPGLGTGNDAKPVIGDGQPPIPRSWPVIGTGNSDKPVLGSGHSDKAGLGHGNRLIPVDPLPLPRQPVLNHQRKAVAVPTAAEKP